MLKMFSVYDSKTEAFLQPFYALATGAAVRMFEEAATDESHHFHKHSGDFTLFEIGAFNDETGQLIPLITHVNLGNAITLRRPAKNMDEYHQDHTTSAPELTLTKNEATS